MQKPFDNYFFRSDLASPSAIFHIWHCHSLPWASYGFTDIFYRDLGTTLDASIWFDMVLRVRWSGFFLVVVWRLDVISNMVPSVSACSQLLSMPISHHHIIIPGWFLCNEGYSIWSVVMLTKLVYATCLPSFGPFSNLQNLCFFALVIWFWVFFICNVLVWWYFCNTLAHWFSFAYLAALFMVFVVTYVGFVMCISTELCICSYVWSSWVVFVVSSA